MHKENNQSQNLEKAIDKNLRTYETNLKEAETLHEQEISKKEKEFTREKNELRKRLENEKLDLQKENATLKLKLEEIQLAAENSFVTNSENILESDFVESSALELERSPAMEKEKSEHVGQKSPLQEKEEGKGPIDENERIERLLYRKDKDKARVQSNTMDDANEFLQKIKEKLKNCIPDGETKHTLKELQTCNKGMKDAINQTISEIDNLLTSKDEQKVASLGDESPKFSIEHQLRALEDIFKESSSCGKSEKSGKDQLNEKLKSIFKNAHISHEMEKLKLKEEHQEERNNLLKEIGDEKRARVKDSLETLRCLQQLDPSKNQFQDYDALKRPTEDKGTSTDDGPDGTKTNSIPEEMTRTGRENRTRTPSDIEEELRREKEDMRRSTDELEKSFIKEKEELMEKLQTQHKEFVMSADGEIIENLLRQKSTLEEVFNRERFYLSRLYYLEMKEELEDILCRKKEKMKRDFERDKMDIVLKYESEIAELHSLLSDRGEMEIRLLQDRNDTMQKLIASQKRKSPEREGKAGDERNQKELLEREKENLDLKIPLKKEIAELQKKRQQEHEAAVANLKEAFDLIKDILSSPPSFSREDDQQLDRYSFVSEDPVTSPVTSPEDKTSERSIKPAKQLLISENEICTKDELKAALENLVEQVLNNDEDSVYDSETTSGESSDLESDDSGPTTVNGESDEGAYSAPESSDGDTMHIKKAELDFAFNLERFNLGRVYYGEYRDSLRKASKKLAKAKDSLRNKRKDLENDMLGGVQKLVERTQFGNKNRPVSKRSTEAQTSEEEQAVIADHEDRRDDDINSGELTETNEKNDRTVNESGNGRVLDDSQGDIENDGTEKKEDNFQEKILEEALEKQCLSEDENPKAAKTVIESKPEVEVTLNENNNQDRPRGENSMENLTIADENETENDSEIDSGITEGTEDSPVRPFKESGSLEDQANEKNVTEQRDNISPSPENTEIQGLKNNKENEPDSSAEIKPKDKSSETPVYKDDKLTTGDKRKISLGQKGEEEKPSTDALAKEDIMGEEERANGAHLERGINIRDESFEKPAKQTKGGNQGDEKQQAKEPITAETENLGDVDGGSSEPEIKASDPSDKKPLNQKPDKLTEERGDTFQKNESADEDVGERQKIREEEIKPEINPKVATLEQPFTKWSERPTEDGESIQEYKDSENVHSEEHFASGDILAEAWNEDHVNGTKEDGRVSAENKNDDRDATEVEIVEDMKGLDIKSEAREKEGHSVTGKEDEIHKPLDEEKWVASDHEGECREVGKTNQDDKSEDCSAGMEDESELGDANEFKTKIEPSHVSPKEGGILDINNALEFDSLSERSDTQSQTTDEDIKKLTRQSSTWPVSDQDLIKELNKNNKLLQSKFNLLRELVGKGFADEIPELSDKKDKEENLAALESVNDLYAEKEKLTDELKQVDSQMTELSTAGDDNLRDLHKRLEDEEIRLLHSLGEISKSIKMNDNEKLREHLLKEKEDVCTKLDEICHLLNEQKEAMPELGSSGAKTVPRLMCKKDALKDDLCEKARQLSYKAKMLEKATTKSGKEKEKLKNSFNSVTVQLAALEEGLRDRGLATYPTTNNKELPRETGSMVKGKKDAENQRAKLEREIKSAEGDIARYDRILKEKRNRLQPFRRKRTRIQDLIDSANSTARTEDEQVSKQSEDDARNGVETSDKSIAEAKLVDKVSDTSDAESERHGVIEAKIEKLDELIRNLKLPRELEKKIVEGIPVADILGIVNRLKPHTEEELDCVEEKILQEQGKLREAGFIHPTKLIEDLEEKENLTKEIDELNNYQPNVHGFRDEEDLLIVKKLENLISKKESLEEKISQLESEISNEQRNFLDARQLQSRGIVSEESESNIKGLLDTKERLAMDLHDANDKILHSLSTGGLKGAQSEFIEECVERKVKLEDQIEKLQDKIDKETVRAAKVLEDLLEQKCAISEELRNARENAIEETQWLHREDSCNRDIPEEMRELISEALLTLESETTSARLHEGQELRQRQRQMEDIIKERAESLREAKRLEQDPDEVEGALEQVIREKIPVDEVLQKTYENENDSKGTRSPLSFASRKQKRGEIELDRLAQDSSKDGNTLDKLIADKKLGGKSNDKPFKNDKYGSESTLSSTATRENDETNKRSEQSEENLDDKRRELQDNLRQTENRLNNMLQPFTPDELQKYDLEKLKSLVAKKVRLKENLRQIELLEDLLNEKETFLQEELGGKDAWKDHWERKIKLKTELKKLNEVIDRRESEVLVIEAKKADKEKRLNKLHNDKEAIDEKIQTMIENIDEKRREIEANLQELMTVMSEHEKFSSDEEQTLNQELQILKDEVELCSKEAEEVERELNVLKEESRQGRDAITGDVLNLQKLLIEKENLREYLTEIDVTLDNSQADAFEQAVPTNNEELRKQKKDVEIKVEEIQEERRKLDVEFEEEEMDEVMKELARLKIELEERKREVSDQIRASGMLGKLAEKRKKRERKIPRYYIEGILDEMTRDEKTLTELIKEHDDLTDASQRQRERLEGMIALVKSKVGEDLFNALASLDIQPDGGNENRPGIDEVQVNEVTISEILNDISIENEELRHMNGEISSDLETLKEKIGEELVEALLRQNWPDKALEFRDVIVAVQDNEETLASLLQRQKGEMDLIKDLLGKDLFCSVLMTEDSLDTGNYANSALELLAPTIMKKYDEDLEHVIAVYEKQLDNLSQENELLKEKLGKDLSRALLQITKPPEPEVGIHNIENDPHSPSTTQGRKADFVKVQFEGKLLSTAVRNNANSTPSVQEFVIPFAESSDKSSTLHEGGDTGSDTEWTERESIGSPDVPKLEKIKIKDPEGQQKQHMEDTDDFHVRNTLLEQGNIPSKKQTSVEARLNNIVESYFTSAVEESSSDVSDEEDELAKGSLKAPTIMRHNGSTLEEVIAQYENDLERPANERAGGGPLRRDERSEFEIADDIPDENETMQGILKAQEKNREMLRLLKERLGEDLVYALINETEEGRHLNDPMTDDVRANEREKYLIKADSGDLDNEKIKAQETSLLEQRSEPVKERTSPEAEEKEDLSNEFSPRTKPVIIIDSESDSGQRNFAEDVIANKRTLKAPSIAIENKTTLAHVIASYEDGLDSLQSKLGPSLTNSLLSMENPTIGESEDSDDRMRKKLEEGAPSEKEKGKAEHQDNDKKNNSKLTDSQGKTPELVSVEETYSGKELRAPDIMATSGKTLEEVIEDYEERINEELNYLEKEVSLLKEKIGKDLFYTLLPHPNTEGEQLQTEETMDRQYSRGTDPRSFSMADEVSAADDLKAKSLLRDDGSTIENILRKYERQLEELTKLVPNESNEGISILDLISNYEDKIADLRNDNKAFANRLENVSEIIGPDLLNKLENKEDEHSKETFEGTDGVVEDGIKLPKTMQKEGKSLETVVRNYEKELEVLRKMLPSQGEENNSISDLIKDYEDKINDLENRHKSVQMGHDSLVSRIGSALVGDIKTLILDSRDSDGDNIHESDGSWLTQEATSQSKGEDRLNAPEIMRRDDSTLEDVLETYEKALGLLPRQLDDSYIDSKMGTFHGLMRENEILKEALGDSVATDRMAKAEKENLLISGDINPMFYLQGTPKEGGETGELNSQSEEKNELVAYPAGNMNQPRERDPKDVINSDVNKLKANELVRDAEETNENILKDYEKELAALRRIDPSETSEGVPVSDLAKEYNDKIEKLENEKNTLLEMFNDLEKTIGPGLMDEMHNFHNTNKESGSNRLNGREPFHLNAPIFMENENKTLEGVIKLYENELDALRKLVPHQGEEAGAISDIIKDYEERIEDLAGKNKILNDELCGLEQKIGHGLATNLKNLAVGEAEATDGVNETDQNGNSSAGSTKRTLKAPQIMNETNLPLEDIVATYEQELNNMKRENEIYKDGLGQDLALALMQLAKDRGNYSLEEFESCHQPGIPKSNEELPDEQGAQSQETNSKYTKQMLQNDVDDAASDDPGTHPDELKTTNLLREEGKDIGEILKNYERELEALRQLTGKTEDGMPISDLINNYENRLEILEMDKKLLTEKLDNLVETIGKDLYDALDNFPLEGKQGDANDYASGKDIGIEVINVMKNYDKTLEKVVRNYEKELIALRQLVPVEKGESGSISDIIKEYEDKLEEFQRRNEHLSKTIDRLEEKIGSSLLKNLTKSHREGEEVGEEKAKQSETQVKSGTQELKTEKELTLEELMASQEKDLKALTKENKALKDGLGPKLARTLLNVAEQKEMPPVKDLDTQNTQVKVEPVASTLPKKEKGYKKQRIDKGSMEDLIQVYAQPFDQINTDETEGRTTSSPVDLKAEFLIRDEGRTIENILQNYEKELETQLIPINDGISISEVIAKYEHSIESLGNEKHLLVSRLKNIEQKIGPVLLSTIENGEPMVELRLKDENDRKDEDSLMAPGIMQAEERTLENVVKIYEKELDALKSLLPDEGDGWSINDMVKAYEDKLDQLRAETRSLRSDSERLVKRIGLNLANDIQKLEEISNDIYEGANQSDGMSGLKTENPVKDLKVTKIMDVKKSTLEEVLETYENALGILLSDSPSTMHKLSSENFTDDRKNTIEELRLENDILRNSLGVNLSERLLDIAKDDKGVTRQISYGKEKTAEILSEEKHSDFDVEESINATKHLPQESSDKDGMRKSLSSPGELKAESLVKEEGRTIENILKNYEKELEALKSPVSTDSGQPIYVISSLVTKYEDEIDEMTERLEFLKTKIGPDLMNDLEQQKYLNTKDNKEVSEGAKSELKALGIMEEENRTLEAVINCYEKELDALRKLAPSQEDGQQVSISDIIKDYEDKLDELNDKNNILQSHYDTLTDRLGGNLVNDIQRLSEDDIEREASLKDEKETNEQTKTAGTQLNAPKTMQENNSTRESILETCKETLGLTYDSTDSPSEDTEKAKVIENQLQTFKELQEENEIFKNTLGEKLARDILEIAKAKDGEALVHLTMQAKDAGHPDALSELAPNRMSFDSEVSTPRDDLKANALMRDKGSTLEEVLKNYEDEIEALSKLIPSETKLGYSISDLVRDYEERIEGLKTESCSFQCRLENLTKKIGRDLVVNLESLPSTKERDEDDLKATEVLQKEGKTLEEIVRNYEKELDALRKIVSEQGENPHSIADIVQEYQDKVDGLKTENESLNNKFDALKQRIGSDLMEDVTSIKSNVTKDDSNKDEESQMFKNQTKLEALRIMQEKSVTLEDVLQSYETALSTAPDDEVMSKVHHVLDDKTIENLEQENKVLKNTLGDSFAPRLLEVNKMEDIAQYSDESLEFSLQPDAVADRVGNSMTSASDRESRRSDEIVELLKEKVGSDLVDELLLLKETDSGTRRRWEAVEKMKEGEENLADILDTYERELERLKREKNAMEVLINDKEGDDQSALDIVSHYEDEIEHLKDKNKELEARLSVLISRIGDDLVNDVVSIKCQQEKTPTSSLRVVEIMAKEDKQLSAVLEQYENDIGKLTRENEMLNTIASNESVDGKPITIFSEYERKIQELLDDKHKTETSLGILSEKVGESLVSAILRPGKNGETSPLDALEIMESEKKTLAEVTEQYETDLSRMKREIGALKDLVSEDLEKSSFMDTISNYEDKISKLNNKIHEQTLLEKKVGIDLSRQLTTLEEDVNETLQNVTFKATEILEKDENTTLADVLKDYEEELEKKEHDISILKELVSGDILEIATSQESEIDELKKVKAILANELDLISVKVGRELTDEIMKRSHEQPKPKVNQFYPEIVERMETEEKSLADILEEYEKEIRLMPSRKEDLSNRENIFVEVSEKIGKDLLNELLKVDLTEGSQTDTKPLFQALELMSMEEKTLGEVIVIYENELEKLKRENGALLLLIENENSQDNSVRDIFCNYEEKIEKLTEENREYNKRLQKISEGVGPGLTNELLKLPDERGKSSARPVNELQALKTLREGQTTLAHVLQNYERRLREGEDDDFGPLVSGKPITEDVKYAELVRVSESEPKITVSENEPLEKSKYLHGNLLNEISPDLYRSLDAEEISPADREQINNLVDVDTTLRLKVERLSRKVGRELAEELMKSPDDNDIEFKAAVMSSSVRDLDAFADVVAERVTLAQVLESYEKQLKQTLQNGKADPGEPTVESRILKEDVKSARLLRASEYELTALTTPSDQFYVEENTCDINEEVVFSHYKPPNADSNLVQGKGNAAARNTNVGKNETDGRIVPVDMDLTDLEDLNWDKPQMKRPRESYKDKEIVQEEIIRVEIPSREEHFNFEYMEELFGSEIPLITKDDDCDEPDSRWPEMYLNEKTPEANESDNYELHSLKKKVKELEKDLEEETNLKEKYEKDVQDLLQDIVDLKMKQAADDDHETPADMRSRIKDEIELKQDNKRLQDDLKKEKKRRLSIEESKKDLLDEVDSLMREKEMLLRQQNDAKDNEKLLEDMINLRKKLGELDTENKHLNKEVKELKEALSEVVVTHEDEKKKLLVDCEKEKSQMMEELMASKLELETQLQELLGMNDDLKGTIKNLQEELKESSEKLSMEGETPTGSEFRGAEINNNEETTIFLVQKLKLLEKEANETERNLLYERGKNEKLKEQLDGTENALKQTFTKYQDEIKFIETEKAKQEDELRKEIEILANKLQLEKESTEQQRKDLENIVQRERERLKGDIEREQEREKKKLTHEFEHNEEELSRRESLGSAELKDQEEQWQKEREELQAIFRVEKEKLQKAFDDELNRKITENDEQHKQRNVEMTMEMSEKFAKEKMEIKAIIEKKIYEQLLDKNITAETDFQEVLSKILQEHAKEIEGVENDIRKAEERFKEDKNKLIEQNDSEKSALRKLHEEEKKALESTIQNLLKEVVKLKQQRKEIRMIHKKEKETMEEIYERDRIKLKDDWEQYKRDLSDKLQKDFDNKLASEMTQFDTRLEETKQELSKSEQKRKELEDRLKENAMDSQRARTFEEAKVDRIDKDDGLHVSELKAVKKSLEEEYDNKLKEEKRKFEETLQGLRREIGNLQEKRRLIQDKIYNQDPTLLDRNLIEKSIANYKAEILSKMEEEVTQKIVREKKPLEETIKEQQIEIDDLKRQRWELRNQIRRERSKLEEEFDLERERIENQFLREKEELKNKLDTRLQREMTKRAMEDKVNRAPSPISNVSTEFCLKKYVRLLNESCSSVLRLLTSVMTRSRRTLIISDSTNSCCQKSLKIQNFNMTKKHGAVSTLQHTMLI